MKYLALFGFFAQLAIATAVGADSNNDPKSSESLLNFAVERGLEIYERDLAAWLATDAVTMQRLEKSGARGWITWHGAGRNWLVRFVGPCADEICTYFDVEVDLETRKSIVTERLEPLIVSDRQAASWRARGLAGRSEFRSCSSNYNAVVIEADEAGELVWVVYLLAADTDPDTVVVGGHHRITVTSDGRNIIRNEALSNSCLTMGSAQEAEGLAVTHVLHPVPIETHVFISLRNGVPVYVGTDRGIYAVEGVRIRLLKDRT